MLPTESTCGVCMQDLVEGVIVAVTGCTAPAKPHIFHGDCLFRWALSEQPTTLQRPACRQKLSIKGLTNYRSLNSSGAPTSEMLILTSTDAQLSASS
eukprot:2437384-Lingulodinium_polyedra.AAC.1